MLEVCTHQFLFLKRKEFWFYDSEKIKRGTYNVFCYSNEKGAVLNDNALVEQSSLIDLTKTREELFTGINRTFKYHIHKAENMGVSVVLDYSPPIEKCRQIMNEFSFFAEKKRIEWNPKRILALQKIKQLIISEAFFNTKKISTHIYLHDNNRVVLLHSYSDPNIQDKKLQGYANKFLHWQDIIQFKNHGLKIYDFGGINMKQHPGISTFKLSFGGNIINCYSYIKVNAVLKFCINFLRKT